MKYLIALLVIAIGGISVFQQQLMVLPSPTVSAKPTVNIPLTLVPFPTVTPQPFATPPASGALVEQVIAVASTYLGTPYLWGGCSHSGIDCSCLARNALAAVSIQAPRVTFNQIAWATPIREPVRGALLFFNNTCSNCGPNPTHVGIALGGGMMIHAGDPVQVVSINTPYWQSHFAGAGWPPGL